ncbi:uncharacterized protein LOC120339880 [Styela clava]
MHSPVKSYVVLLLPMIILLILRSGDCKQRICFEVPDSTLSDEVQVSLNYDRIDEIVSRHINQVMKEWHVEMRQRFEDQGQILKHQFKNSTTAMKEKLGEVILFNKTQDCPVRTDKFPDELCEVRRDDACYWTYDTYSNTLTYSAAEKLCKSKNSTVAIIPDRSVYNAVRDSLNKRLPNVQAGYVDAWLGIRVDPRSGQIIYPDPDVFKSWGYNAPSKGEDKTQVYLFSSPRFYGMVNDAPTGYQSGVVCQI